ncbi:MAG: hypothetical protein M5T61_03310 [Acidimicrobiia bacterium]|nr:hypothetical protein [Acidimicrobiia bacterium]
MAYYVDTSAFLKLGVGDELEGIVTYDERLAEAAALHGVNVVTPK